MWTRSLLKRNAKQALGGRYWKCFLVTLIITILSGGLSGILSGVINVNDTSANYSNSFYVPDHLSSGLMMVLGVFAVFAGIASLCWTIFVVNPLQVAHSRYYMESRQAPAPYTTVTGIFRKPYGNVVEVELLTALKILLGSLIIIPGIYWSFCYAMVPYLLAENPYLTTRRAMELSKDMMYGEKWNYFVLQLSFIGWWLLAVLTIGIGTFFLLPYINATNAEFYAAMRAKALGAGVSTPQELAGFMRHEGI